MTANIDTLAQQVKTLDEFCKSGFAELKALIKDEILELKREQLADIKRENERIADDQRRAWDAIRALEQRDSERKGGFKVVHALWAAVLAALGGIATLIVAWKH